MREDQKKWSLSNSPQIKSSLHGTFTRISEIKIKPNNVKKTRQIFSNPTCMTRCSRDLPDRSMIGLGSLTQTTHAHRWKQVRYYPYCVPRPGNNFFQLILARTTVWRSSVVKQTLFLYPKVHVTAGVHQKNLQSQQLTSGQLPASAHAPSWKYSSKQFSDFNIFD